MLYCQTLLYDTRTIKHEVQLHIIYTAKQLISSKSAAVLQTGEGKKIGGFPGKEEKEEVKSAVIAKQE